jgi:superoxide dismutase, Fe-Mn family
VKADYINALWNIVNREDVTARFVDACNGLNGLRIPTAAN